MEMSDVLDCIESAAKDWLRLERIDQVTFRQFVKQRIEQLGGA